MPKNPLKGFARRKSSGNVLDLQPEQPVQSSFRVLERPEKVAPSGGPDKRLSSGRPLSSIPFPKGKGKSTEDLGGSTNRGSGTTTLSGSSGYYDTSSSSARYSSTSTLPSSFDQEHEQAQEELFAPSKGEQHVYHNRAPASGPGPAPVGPANPSFSSRASRAMSFGLRSNSKRPESQVAFMPEAEEQVSGMPDVPDHAAIRDRAMTVSSYASTAVPPRLDHSLGGSDFSSDFGNMFEGLGDSKKETPLPPPPRAHGGYKRSDPEPLFQHRVLQRQAATPSPDPEAQLQPQPLQRANRPDQLAPSKRYSWQSRTSHDGLMSPGIESERASSPQSSEFSQNTAKPNPGPGFGRFKPGYQPLPVRNDSPAHDQGSSQPTTPNGVPNFFGRPPVRHIEASSDDDDESSQQDYDSRPSTRDDPKPAATPVRAPPPLQQHQQQQRNGQAQQMPPVPRHPAVLASARDDLSSTGSADGGSTFGRESQNTTPRAMKLQRQQTSEDLFDVAPTGPPRPAMHSMVLPPRLSSANASSSPKKMTKAQFEMQQASRDDYRSDSENGSEYGYDDGDEEEVQAELTRQRRKQEANLAVYRQQMKKVSGGNPSELPGHAHRPSMDRASLSAPTLQQGMYMVPEGADEEEDDDVPLGILQAHGFPNKNRPPVHVGSAPATPGSQAGSVMGDAPGGVLPPFARRLPPDPYFGAGLVHHANRESLTFGGTTGGSVYGGGAPAVQPPPMHPGGLVGVIAGEERARALRRGSPNPATGGYGPIPLPSNIQQQMPMMPRSNSMMSMMQPQMGAYPQQMQQQPLMPPSMQQLQQMQQMQMPQMPQMPQMQQMQQMPQMNSMAMDNQQQMIQMMQMQQQMMQSLIAMQSGQPPPPPPNFGLQQSPSMNNGFLDPNLAPRPLSMAGPGQGPPNAGRSMSMMQSTPQWNGNPGQGRSNTMGSTSKPMGYAGSVYNYNLSAPAPGYTPSIAPSERSNIGMPSRYRPVSTNEANGGNSRTQTMNSNMDSYARHNGSAPSLLGVNPQAPQNTIRVIDKPKGAPRSSPARNPAEDEDEDEGWAAMRQKREARKKKGTLQNRDVQPTLGELYTNME